MKPRRFNKIVDVVTDVAAFGTGAVLGVGTDVLTDAIIDKLLAGRKILPYEKVCAKVTVWGLGAYAACKLATPIGNGLSAIANWSKRTNFIVHLQNNDDICGIGVNEDGNIEISTKNGWLIVCTLEGDEIERTRRVSEQHTSGTQCDTDT